MRLNLKISKYQIKQKLVTLLFITASAAAFATLGDGGSTKKPAPSSSHSLLSFKPTYNYKHFSLKSSHNYRGNNVLSGIKQEDKYITLNTLVTYQKGNATYVLPLKKKVLLDKVKLGSHPQRY
jgi:hypothetical protein